MNRYLVETRNTNEPSRVTAHFVTADTPFDAREQVVAMKPRDCFIAHVAQSNLT